MRIKMRINTRKSWIFSEPIRDLDEGMNGDGGGAE
jgi:hypothetical protein